MPPHDSPNGCVRSRHHVRSPFTPNNRTTGTECRRKMDDREPDLEELEGIGAEIGWFAQPFRSSVIASPCKGWRPSVRIPWPHWIVVRQSVGSLSDHIAQRLAPAYSKDPLGLIRQRGSKPPIRERNNFNVGDVLSVLYPITKPTFGELPVSGRLMTDQGRKFLA